MAFLLRRETANNTLPSVVEMTFYAFVAVVGSWAISYGPVLLDCVLSTCV